MAMTPYTNHLGALGHPAGDPHVSLSERRRDLESDAVVVGSECEEDGTVVVAHAAGRDAEATHGAPALGGHIELCPYLLQ